MDHIVKNRQYFKFCFYGFLKNLRFFDAFFILFLIDKDLSFTQIGTLYAVREIFINVFEIPSGIIADTYGKKYALSGSLLAYIGSFLIFYISTTYWLFAAAFILYGIGDAFRSGTHKGMIMDYLEIKHWQGQKTNYYGHTRSWSQKGSAVSSLIAGVIVFYSGTYQNSFLFSVIPYILNLLLILSYPKSLNHAAIQKDHQKKLGIKQTFLSFINTIKNPTVLKIVNTSAFHTAYMKAVKDYIQPIMLNIALILPVLLNLEQEKKNGIVIGVIYFFIYLLTSFASKRSAQIGKSSPHISITTLLTGFILGTFCGIFFHYSLWGVALIAFIGIFIIENIRKPILTGFIANNVPVEILTSVISAQSLLKTILTTILSLSFGFFADHYGIGSSFIIISVFLIIATLLLNTYAMHRNHNQ